MGSLRTTLSGKGRAIAMFAGATVLLVVTSMALSASAGPWLFGESASARNVIRLTRCRPCQPRHKPPALVRAA